MTDFLDAFPGGQVFYAMKANANPQIIQLVVDRHGGLEIASLAELERSLDAGAIGEQIICSNPIKNPVFLERMHQAGVYAMVVDFDVRGGKGRAVCARQPCLRPAGGR